MISYLQSSKHGANAIDDQVYNRSHDQLNTFGYEYLKQLLDTGKPSYLVVSNEHHEALIAIIPVKDTKQYSVYYFNSLGRENNTNDGKVGFTLARDISLTTKHGYTCLNSADKSLNTRVAYNNLGVLATAILEFQKLFANPDHSQDTFDNNVLAMRDPNALSKKFNDVLGNGSSRAATTGATDSKDSPPRSPQSTPSGTKNKPSPKTKPSAPQRVDAKAQNILYTAIGAGVFGIASYAVLGSLPKALSLASFGAACFSGYNFNLSTDPISRVLNSITNNKPAIVIASLAAGTFISPLYAIALGIAAYGGIQEAAKNYAPAAVLSISSLFYPPLAPLAASYVGYNVAKELGTLWKMAPLGLASIAYSAYLLLEFHTKAPNSLMTLMAACTPSISTLATTLITSYAHSFTPNSNTELGTSFKWGTTCLCSLPYLPMLYKGAYAAISAIPTTALTALTYAPHVLAYTAAGAIAKYAYNNL
jgi:hypothetical protein